MKAFVLPVLLMSAAASFANEAADDAMNRSVFQSQLTRPAVQSEFVLARVEGTLPDTSETGSMYAQLPPFTRFLVGGLHTRAQVRDEYLRARADGTLPDTTEIGSVYASMPAIGPTPSHKRGPAYATSMPAAETE